MITDEQFAEWERLAGAAGPFHSEEQAQEEWFKCPLCDGEGETEGVRFDAKDDASTVVAYGIGVGLGRAEAFVERAPGDVLRLVAALREARALLAEARDHLNEAHDCDEGLPTKIDAFLGGES